MAYFLLKSNKDLSVVFQSRVAEGEQSRRGRRKRPGTAITVFHRTTSKLRPKVMLYVRLFMCAFRLRPIKQNYVVTVLN